MLEMGVASAEDIDRGMELGYRHPMGPLKLTDLVGLDVRLAILDHLTKEIGDQFRPPAILRVDGARRQARQEDRRRLLQVGRRPARREVTGSGSTSQREAA